MCWLLTEILFNLSHSETGNRVKMERRYTDIEIYGPVRLQAVSMDQGNKVGKCVVSCQGCFIKSYVYETKSLAAQGHCSRSLDVAECSTLMWRSCSQLPLCMIPAQKYANAP